MPPSTSKRQDFPTPAAGSSSTVRLFSHFSMHTITQLRIFTVMRDRKWVAEFVKRAEVAGYSALCLTVDLPIQGLRQRDIFNKFLLPSNCQMVNFGKAPRDLAASTGVRNDQQAHNTI
jgi:isopentenyl diphosphate isomerase/L-lactate dehydrogenase-like FMN-dependent dehydrogenase